MYRVVAYSTEAAYHKTISSKPSAPPNSPVEYYKDLTLLYPQVKQGLPAIPTVDRA
jgi:hypothetical protein